MATYDGTDLAIAVLVTIICTAVFIALSFYAIYRCCFRRKGSGGAKDEQDAGGYGYRGHLGPELYHSGQISLKIKATRVQNFL